MRTTQYLLWRYIILVSILLTGCQTDSEIPYEPQAVKGVISIQSQSPWGNEGSVSSAFAIESQRDDNTKLVYTIEVWTREKEPRRILHKVLTGNMRDGVRFEISLLPDTYDFLFWADYGMGHYLTTNLRQVTVTTDSYQPGAQNDAFAYTLTQEWDSNIALNATLKRPVARINIHNNGAFDHAEKVSMVYQEIYTTYDVLTGNVSAPLQAMTISYPETEVGGSLIGEDFLFVPEQETMSFSVTVGGITKAMDNVPLKPNYNTNITTSF